MNNEPVAWMNAHTGHLCSGGFLMAKMQDYIPLYTHPAKTLTDEEIIEVWGNQIITETEKDAAIPFARAILRKAQEK
jgi:hypothetical protein